MRNRHVEIEGSKIVFQFRGKSGKMHRIDLQDRRLAAIVKRCRELPGYELFQYTDDAGAQVGLDSGMINQYLRDTAGEDVTAKDFRTWHGSVHAAEQLLACGPCTTETEIKHNIVAATKAVAELLGNRPATCRKHYVHPAILELYGAGQLTEHMNMKVKGRNPEGLTPSERCLLRILQSTQTGPALAAVAR
jgi:DNA topoisomerase I